MLVTFLAYITWDANPIIFDLGFLQLRWYGVLFASSFLIGHYLLQRIWRTEGRSQNDLDLLVIYVMLGSVIGGRLGHVFFYGWSYYSQHLDEIPKVWEGGLASHGGAIGLILALLLFIKQKKGEYTFLWLGDRICVAVPIVAASIRLGNLMNSEIYGKPTDVPWAFIYTRGEDLLPRHPTQLYESFSYLLVLGLMLYSYRRFQRNIPEGLLAGILLVSLFTVRFVLEFFKEVQESWEKAYLLDMGQILSIPFIALGIYLLLRARRLHRAAQVA